MQTSVGESRKAGKGSEAEANSDFLISPRILSRTYRTSKLRNLERKTFVSRQKDLFINIAEIQICFVWGERIIKPSTASYCVKKYRCLSDPNFAKTITKDRPYETEVEIRSPDREVQRREKVESVIKGVIGIPPLPFRGKKVSCVLYRTPKSKGVFNSPFGKGHQRLPADIRWKGGGGEGHFLASKINMLAWGGKGKLYNPQVLHKHLLRRRSAKGWKEKENTPGLCGLLLWRGNRREGGRGDHGQTAAGNSKYFPPPPPPLFSLLQSSSLLFFGHFLSEKWPSAGKGGKGLLRNRNKISPLLNNQSLLMQQQNSDP